MVVAESVRWAPSGDTASTGLARRRKRRNDRRWLVVCWAVAVVATLLNLTLLVLNRKTAPGAGPEAGLGEPFLAVAYLAVATLGLVVRRRDVPIGWVFSTSGLALALGALATEYATYALVTDPGALPAAPVLAWAGAAAWWGGAGFGLTFGVLLYPDGRLPSPSWRPVAVALAASLVVLVLLQALTPGPLDGEYRLVDNPVGLEPVGDVLRPLREVSWALLATSAAAAGSAAIARRRRASGPHRTHLAWLAAAAWLAAVAAPVWGMTKTQGDPPALATAVVVSGVFAVPFAVAAALARTAMLRRSVERLVLAREDERRRIRRDLHDGLGPTLAGIVLQVDLARSLVEQDPATAGETLDRVAARVQRAIADVRRIVDDLRPPVLDQLGLVDAIREGAALLTGPRHDGGPSVSVEVLGHLGPVPPAAEVAAFRIVMEALTNACRHGGATRCRVHLVTEGGLHIRVEDDGRGLPAEVTPGVGLGSMRDRAVELGGRCDVTARPGGGAIVSAFLPVPNG